MCWRMAGADVDIATSRSHDPGRVLKMRNGTEKSETPIFHQPADLIAIPAAAETIGMAIEIHPVRRRPFRAERAERDIFTTGTLYRHVRRDQRCHRHARLERREPIGRCRGLAAA